MKKLKKKIEDDIFDLVRKAQHSRLKREYKEAIKLYKNALELLPAPAEQWEEALTIYLNLGETYFIQDKLEEAFDCFANAIKCPHGLGYPFLHLRLGQIRFDFGQTDKAKDELMRAYMGEGISIFEKEDPKYFQLIQPFI